MISRRPRIIFLATIEFAVRAFLIHHLRALSKHFDVTVIVNTDDPFFLKKQGVSVNVIPLNISRNINIFSDVCCLVRLVYIFIKIRPSAVHSITPKAGLLGMLAAFITRVSLRIHTFTGQVWVTSYGLKKLTLKCFDFLTAHMATINIVDSTSQQLFLINQKIIKKDSSVVFGSGSVSGVDLKKFKSSKKIRDDIRKELSIPDNAFVYIFLGRLNKDKGVLDLATAFSKIKDDRVFLIMVGPDEANLSHKIESLVSFKQDKLKMVGFLSDPRSYLAASDVLCLPSYREGFGSVIIEAGAMGIPSIASNIYGISDAIQDQKTGLLHPPKDVNEILRCMEIFLLNPKLAKSFGVAAKNRVVNEFDAKILTHYWLELYLNYLH